MTHGFWQQTYGGDPDVLGRTMVLDGVIHTVVALILAAVAVTAMLIPARRATRVDPVRTLKTA